MTASSPTFVAKFADGTVTRMTTFCEPGEGQRPETFEWLDLQRGIALSRIAYESRKKKKPPGFINARFEIPDDGVILKTYTADELNSRAETDEAA